ncbi:Piso0_004025 [Millerozyma farinosa CBS 7064]|uniref:Malate dehydrogenase n=1 Tax=Pichia sorbitophila (strain ATCC MYA-4447 / BCRC 22081 / CBS 7064 / NBRC 10061 / NRRL Y-12695) TaxID=559304 RepID=G8Y7A1_PICSO|nr:Piso0_004025 [Millerozyma farinosa CBS 7064]CCE84481.1 Piso0_004025 [Millerozyma farinosa CBS 7064]
MVKVTVCGAAGGIGQPLSLLLKLNLTVSQLSLYDIVNANGVAADLSHISTPAVVEGFQPKSKDDKDTIKKALSGSDIVVIPAGSPRKPGMTRDDLFNINASIVRDIVINIGHVCPKATILIISNPVNSTVPVAAEVLKRMGVFDPSKLFGVTTLDTVRAETFLAGLIGEDPASLKGKISVIGGHSGETIVPLINVVDYVSEKAAKLSKKDYDAFIQRVQFGGDEVVKAKNGVGSATLSMALAGYRFTLQVLSSLSGEKSFAKVPDSAYVYLPGLPNGQQISAKYLNNISYFSLPVNLENGAVKSLVNPFDSLSVSSDERKLIDVALTGLQKNIAKGTSFVKSSKF